MCTPCFHRVISLKKVCITSEVLHFLFLFTLQCVDSSRVVEIYCEMCFAAGILRSTVFGEGCHFD